MSISRRCAAAVGAATVLLGCMPVRSPESSPHPAHGADAHIEAVTKQQGSYELLAGGRVRIFARGEFVLDHEDEKNLYVVIYDPPAVIEPTFPATSRPVLSTAPIRDATGAMKVVDIGQGLPHRGQWRDHFAVGDILGDGTVQIVFGPSRKSGGGGATAFRAHDSGWEKVALRVPAGHYDYGAAAVGDIDGDGRNDLVLAMHLTGFSVLRATGPETFERIDTGLPGRNAAATQSGSGHAAMVLPAAPHEPAPVLLLQEAASPAVPGKPRAPALAMFHYTQHGFAGTAIDASPVPGNNLAFAPGNSACKAKLAIAGAALGPPIVLESTDKNIWTARAIESFADPHAAVAAVALGDIDRKGCSDLVVSYSSRLGDAWHSVADIYLDRGTGWQRINVQDSARGARVTALAVAQFSGRGIVLALDDVGTLRIYRIAGDSAQLVLSQPAPEWRRGCAGSDIHLLPDDASGHVRVAASFAGEPTMGQFDRCRNGGGIEAWRIE